MEGAGNATLVPAIATAIGVAVAAVGLLLNREQARTRFEDSLASEYRELVRRLPMPALLGETMSREEVRDELQVFYEYLDLSNSQVFLRSKDRIRASTWAEWVEGIQNNFERPAFREAWRQIKDEHDLPDFQELEQLQAEKFQRDPLDWREQG
jgi:hypothetical protein